MTNDIVKKCIELRIDYNVIDSLITNYYCKVLRMKREDAERIIFKKMEDGKFDSAKTQKYMGWN